jgi:hypothetical protein
VGDLIQETFGSLPQWIWEQVDTEVVDMISRGGPAGPRLAGLEPAGYPAVVGGLV